MFSPPVGVQGFICTLPTNWTRGEKNDSGINLTILAQLFEKSDQKLAEANGMRTEGTRRT
jgi:phospholipase D1/2